MARYIGPKTKIARKFGDPIYGPDKYFERKNFPPGQHGLNKKRKKASEYVTSFGWRKSSHCGGPPFRALQDQALALLPFRRDRCSAR